MNGILMLTKGDGMMDGITKLLEGLERVTVGEGTSFMIADYDVSKEPETNALEATNIVITTILAEEKFEWVANGMLQTRYSAGVTDDSELLPTHEKQLRQALKSLEGFTVVVRVEPVLKEYFDDDTGKEKKKVFTRLIAADEREVTP